jgi:hypothetical protein
MLQVEAISIRLAIQVLVVATTAEVTVELAATPSIVQVLSASTVLVFQ